MGLNIVFALLLAVFLGVWTIWLMGISRDTRPIVIGGGVAVVLAAAALLLVNSSRLDQQRDDYGEQAIAYLGAVASEQQDVFASTGSYGEEPPELSESITTYDDGVLANERELDLSISTERDSYTAVAEIEGQSYTLQVSGTGGGAETTRTCEAPEAAVCVDGSWEPVSS